MPAAKSLAGQVFGRLTVLERYGSRQGRVNWLCRCECGKLHEEVSHALTSGHTKSCGCWNRGGELGDLLESEMNDRELLELAAKAVGIKHNPSLSAACRGERIWWNPLTDDGDALRLACDLGLRVYPVARTSSGAACSAVGSVTCERLSEVADYSLDTRTATRRAIVRAAAEIGKEMK